MSRPYLITYKTFTGSTVRRVWRGKDPATVRNKALHQADCASIGPVQEIAEDLFQRLQTEQRKHSPYIRIRPSVRHSL